MRSAALVLCSFVLAGCGAIGELLDPGLPPVVASLTVYNRTEAPLTLVAADGEQLAVPACGDANDPDFRIDSVQVGSEGLYVHSFGRGDGSGEELAWVQVAGDGSASGFTDQGPSFDPLPACRGLPLVQRNVQLEH
jgi:hypothetical protein